MRLICSPCKGVPHLFVQLKHLLLGGHLSLVHVVAAHLILVLEQQLPICEGRRVLDVLEVLHSLQQHEPLNRNFTQFNIKVKVTLR